MIHFKEYKHADIVEVLYLHNPDMTEKYIWNKFLEYYKPSAECAIFFYIPTEEEEIDPEWGFEDWQLEIVQRLASAGAERGQGIYLDVSF